MDNSNNIARLVVNELLRNFQAQISVSETDTPLTHKRMTFDVSVLKREDDPYELNFPFKSFYVENASDTSAYVQCKLHSKDNDRDYFILTKKDSAEMGSPARKAYLYWPAQGASKFVTVIFLVDGIFRPGSQINQNSGGVSINDGSTVTSDAALAAGLAAAIMIPADTDRKVTTIQNQGSTSIWVGGSTVTVAGGARPGVELQPGATLVWRNTAALYAIALVANTLIASVTEK